MSFSLISPQIAKYMLEKNNDTILIDIRDPFELEIISLRNIDYVNIPSGEIMKNLDMLKEHDSIILMCRTDRRSKIAAQELCEVKYMRVYIVEGGIARWFYDFPEELESENLIEGYI